MTAVALKFQVGARTLASVRRRLVRIGLSLDEVLAGHVPALPASDGGWTARQAAASGALSMIS